jgi:hypothetical protein
LTVRRTGQTSRVFLAIVAVVFAAVSSACATRDETHDVMRVLFVGNSLTYVGNLPAVFDAVEIDGRRLTESEMIVAPGATLTDRVRDNTVAGALAKQSYSFVVLQERGGDFACGFGPEVCADARKSLSELADLIRSHGATPILMGTYQPNGEASSGVADAEAAAAAESGVDYVRVAERLTDFREAHPGMNWFAPDGMHPGPDLTLLEALLLFRRVHGVSPPPTPIVVRAPPLEAPVRPVVRKASATPDFSSEENVVTYDARRVTILLGAMP